MTDTFFLYNGASQKITPSSSDTNKLWRFELYYFIKLSLIICFNYFSHVKLGGEKKNSENLDQGWARPNMEDTHQ